MAKVLSRWCVFLLAVFAISAQAQSISISELIDAGGDGTNSFDPGGRIVVDSVGNTYVEDRTNSRIFKITPSGDVSLVMDASGGGGGVLAGFLNLVLDSADNLYVAGRDSDNVFQITPSGVISVVIDSTGDTIGNSLEGPSAMMVDGSDNLYISGYDSDNVFKIAPPYAVGDITELIDSTGDAGNTLNSPGKLVLDSGGNLYVTGTISSNVFKISSVGVITEAMDNSTGLEKPGSIGIDNADNIYVAGFNSDNVFKITAAGVVSTILDSTGDGTNVFDTPYAMAVDGAGNVYVNGYVSDNVFKIDAAGVITVILDTALAGTTVDSPYAIVLDSNGSAYVSSLSVSKVFKITSAGVVSLLISSSGDGKGNSLGQAAGLALDSIGNIYVVGNTSNNAFIISYPPTVTGASYDVVNGVLIVTGTDLEAKTGADNDIDATRFSFTGETGTSYMLTDTANVEITNATTFTLTLSATDKAAVNILLDNNGSNAGDATAYNLVVADNFNTNVISGDSSDSSGNSIAVSGNVLPTIDSAVYDAGAGVLIVTATNLSAKTGGSNDIDASKLTFTGETAASYILTDSADVEITNATTFTLTLSPTDKAAVNLLLDNNGVNASDGTPYNLAVGDDFNAQIIGDDSSDNTGNVIAVSGVVAELTLPPGVEPLNIGNFRLTLEMGSSLGLDITGGTQPYRISLSDSSFADVQLDGVTVTFEPLKLGSFVLFLYDDDGQSDILFVTVVAEGSSAGVSGENEDSLSDFRDGITPDNGASFFPKGSFSVGEEIQIFSLIKPPLEHQGQQAGILIAVVYRALPDIVKLITAEGESVVFDETLQFFDELILTEVNEVNITRDIAVPVTRGDIGIYDVYVAYQLFSDGQIYVNSEPMVVEIYSLDADNWSGLPTLSPGVTADNGRSFFSDGSFTLGEMIEIYPIINPQPEHLGEQAEFVVTVIDRGIPGVEEMLTNDNQLVEDDQVVIVFDEVKLRERNIVDITRGKPITLTANELGTYEIYVGYRLLGEEQIYMNTTPIVVEVLE
ncbi:MAG: hypothetical protein COC19_01715 [SAR86 cluster bacterium]|uniref:SMP-30/Gluconolactonase/LRE-like region domain-containing protein n=1 Tax=SAR86 cluster bacterium TaxID=2030880 RepID=A0A2A4MTG2_9GAMM|nr:MAG: hypothetical protein COC19_01715 [SAR86 cluster bacterium]